MISTHDCYADTSIPGYEDDKVAQVASRVMGLVVSGISLLVDARSEGRELAFGFTLVVIITVSFVAAVRLTRCPALAA